MTKKIVDGQEWDIDKVDGNVVTLKGGQQIEVSDETLAKIKSRRNK